MVLVFFLILAQGAFQVVGVASVFPFLALASNPEVMSEHRVAEILRSWIPGLDTNGLLLLAGVVAVVTLVVSNIINMASEFGRTRYSLSLGQWLRVRMMTHVATRPYGYFLTTNPSLLIKKIGGDVSGFISGVFLPMLDILVRIVCVVLLLALLIVVDVQIAMGAALIFGTIYTALLFGLKTKTARISAELKACSRRSMKALYQFVSGIKVILVQDRSSYFINCYHVETLRQAKLSAIIPVISNMPKYLIEPLAFGGLVVVVLVLSIQGKDFKDLIPVLGVMAFAGYRLLPSLQFLYGGLTGIMAQKHTLEEVAEEFEGGAWYSELPPQAERAVIPFESALELREVSFSYPGSRMPVLRGISLQIEKGSSFAIVGSTGSGKSTAIDLLMGLHWPSSGELVVDGRTLGKEDMASWRQQIGYVPQDIFLLDDTVAKNIAFGLPSEEIDVERLREAARAAQILDFIESELSHGFDTTVGDRGVRLSGGQRQRIGLARALYRNPSILVLDEATSALDNRTETELMRSVEALGKAVTVIMVAHRMSTVQRCDTIVMLENGQLRAKGRFEQLLAKDEAFQRLVAGK